MTTVVGGVYDEYCIEPYWDDVYGSGGRAAAALSTAIPDLRLVTYCAQSLKDGLENLKAAYRIAISGISTHDGICFEYVHSLSVPRITPRPDAIQKHGELSVEDDVVLRFGMMEGSAHVKAKRAVYDPQSAFDPRPFGENGSNADTLALILNRAEAHCLTDETDTDAMARKLISNGEASVVVLKLGGHGALVATKEGSDVIPAYKSQSVWKIGSGDVFSAAFTLYWAVEHKDPTQAADLASRATSHYCGTRALPIPPADILCSELTEPVRPGSGQVYIAAPFFDLGEQWLVEEARTHLLKMGVRVFSPLHDVGIGPASRVTQQDLKGLDESDAVLAILNSGDPGTVFEVGYAVARGIPVVVLAQNMRPEDLKMPEGSGCRITQDLVSAIHHAVWSLA
ncbi:MAG: nucleoside 2-deoxyribosyltransferase [Gammaproteobacteria bacterium]|nr:nucleoside 2-deoxyribosyltransferase [Gammaproteobacteria bacterium]MYF66519.1 nucleoside 2-deoxyribosyltransferase [Gammaproteobacteria bacterium]MYK37168.1 nucleoside 2-deoxyribosyltransferase [Gammaproteobacteria bacterium]